jgi:2-deoxy-D-gluconate 3-dehydrogenase
VIAEAPSGPRSPLSPFDLSGRRALVTGGATGLGAAIAAGLAAAGCRVAITVNRRSADELARQLAEICAGLDQYAVDLAVATPERLGEIVDEVEGRTGPIDILVNNAGIIRRSPALEHSAANWDDVISLNLGVPWHLSQAVGRRMIGRGHGRVLMIASMLSFQGGINGPGYSASKHAVVGLVRALANEWAPHGLTVNAIAPGYIETAATEALRADQSRSGDILARIPAGRWGKPEDIAGATVFLASDAASYVNGHVLAVDGGWLAR